MAVLPGGAGAVCGPGGKTLAGGAAGACAMADSGKAAQIAQVSAQPKHVPAFFHPLAGRNKDIDLIPYQYRYRLPLSDS
jgi:hypothetical protein